MGQLLSGQRIIEEERASLIARLRLVRSFSTVRGRQLIIIARLLASSILMYSRNLAEDWTITAMLYDGFIGELTTLLMIEDVFDPLIDTIKTESLRTLASIVSLGKPTKLNLVLESLGANSYHGFLARITRCCVNDLRCGKVGIGNTSVQFCTALFSLLYHLAGFDNGSQALISCSMTEILLSVVSCTNLPVQHISFVTRAVRVMDIMTSLDANGFTACNGMNIIIQRLITDVNMCMKHLLESKNRKTEQCHQQRAALIKSLLNFVRRAVQDTHLTESVRHSKCMCLYYH
ncbi:unnamed protein product [Gongylonema pulchrum]|uniref:Uncharacterized protein n=1 Tax=Gongylonema pulchrum TaxID=637853 RepID=A0A3P7NAC9_9BILA|nr:unnamed protein product [Gongylonema pulchrum]